MTERERISRNKASRNWKRRNPEHARLAHKSWVARNAERRGRYMKEYNSKRKEQQREYDKARYLRPENVLKREAGKVAKSVYMRTWMQKNRAKKINYWNKRRRHLKDRRIGDISGILNWIRSWRTDKIVRCYWCLGRFIGIKCHVDHIEPISLGGSHSLQNLCISCPKCNRAKHDKTVSEWNLFLDEPVLL